MGLLQTYGSANRVVTNDKVVTYSMRLISGNWTYLTALNVEVTLHSAYEYHRYCTKTYSYVGMDKATANACAQAMVNKYTRTFYISEWNSSG